MGIIGFSFTKFDCEKKATRTTGSIEIKHNISIKDVLDSSVNMGGNKTDALKIVFSFDVLYGSGIGKICVVGDVIYNDTKEILEETKKGWDAEKKLNSTVSEVVYKFVYAKTAVKVLDLADSLNLPSPIPMPKINFSKEEKKTEK